MEYNKPKKGKKCDNLEKKCDNLEKKCDNLECDNLRSWTIIQKT